MFHLLLSALAAIVYVIGGLFMAKSGIGHLLFVYSCFIVGATFQTWATQHIASMSVTYLVTLGLEAALSMGAGVFLLEENLSGIRLVGAGLVIIGIAILRGR